MVLVLPRLRLAGSEVHTAGDDAAHLSESPYVDRGAFLLQLFEHRKAHLLRDGVKRIMVFDADVRYRSRHAAFRVRLKVAIQPPLCIPYTLSED